MVVGIGLATCGLEEVHRQRSVTSPSHLKIIGYPNLIIAGES